MSVFYPEAVRNARAALRVLKQQAEDIRNSNPMKFNLLIERARSMREVSREGLAPILAEGGQAAVNNIVGRFIGGWGPNPYGAILDVQSALGPFFLACRNLVASVQDPVSFDFTNGISYADVNTTSLQPSLDNLLTALAALE